MQQPASYNPTASFHKQAQVKETRKDRAYTDNPNQNNRVYRESESHAKVVSDLQNLRDTGEIKAQIYNDVHHPLCYCEEHQQKTFNSDQNKLARRFPMLREYAKIKENIDLQEQLQMEMRKFVHGGNVPEFGGPEGMSSYEGLSGFRDDIGNGTTEEMIPSDKILLGQDQTSTGVAASSTVRDINQNPNLSGINERPMGNTSHTVPMHIEQTNNPFLAGQQTKTEGSQVSDVGTLLHNPTINQQIRNRMIVKNQDGQPMIKQYKPTFVPSNKSQAKQDLKNDTFTMFENEHDLSKLAKMEDLADKKSKQLHGDFKRSNQFDNSLGNNWNIRNTNEMIMKKKQSDNYKRTTLRNTADKFLAGNTAYMTNLQQIDDLPRLSILENYKSIKKIMNQNYIKGREQERKFRNRTSKDNQADEEFQKWRDEQQNSQKMSTILRSLNTTKKKKPTTLNKQFSNAQISAGSMSMSHNLPPSSLSRPMLNKVDEENDEISNV